MSLDGFRESGIGSRAWYIRAFKRNAHRNGFTWLKEESKGDGKTIQFDEFKSAVELLVSAGYLKTAGRPEVSRFTRYEVTSFGHRYLEEHKDELPPEAAPQAASTVDPEKPSTLLHREQTVPDAPAIRSPFTEVRTEAVVLPTKPVVERAITEVKQAAKVMSKLKAPEALNPRKSTELPFASGVFTQKSAGLSVDDLKRFAGEILYAKHAQEVTVVDLIEHISSKEDSHE